MLDLACGTGRYATAIAQFARVFLGIDASKQMLSYTKNAHPGFQLVLGDALNLPLTNESIEVVVCIGLFEFVDRLIVLREIQRTLKPNGILILGVPNKYSAIRIMAKTILKLRHIDYDKNEPSQREMIKLFERCEFQMLQLIKNDGLIWLPNLLDSLIGEQLYSTLGLLFKRLRNPFSNNMVFVVRKQSTRNN